MSKIITILMFFIIFIALSFYLGKSSQPSENLDVDSVVKRIRNIQKEYKFAPKFQVSYAHNMSTQQLELWVDINGFLVEPFSNYLKNIHDISFLTVSASDVSVEDMRFIKSLHSSLTFLRFDSCNIQQEGISLLSGVKLRSFELCDSNPSVQWVPVLESMKNLEELHLWHISDFHSYAQMLPNLSKLRVLTLHDVKLTPEDMIAFRKLKSLQYLFVDEEYVNHPEIRKLFTSQINQVKIYSNRETGVRPALLIEYQ